VGELVEVGGEVVARHGELAGAVKVEEARLGLDGELVERQVVAADPEHRGELRRPVGRRLPRARVDEVGRDGGEDAPGEGERAAGRRRVVPAAEGGDMVAPAFNHLMEYGSLDDLSPEQLAEAEDWAALDPYQEAGVYKKVTVKPFKKVFP